LNTWKALAHERSSGPGRYLVTVSDAWLLDHFIKSMVKIRAEYGVTWCRDFDETLEESQRSDLFSEGDRIIIFDGYKHSDAERVTALIESSLPDDVIIIINRGRASRAKAVSHLISITTTVTTDKPKPWELAEWLHGMMTSSGYKLTQEVAAALAEKAGPDLASIASEVEKLSLYRPEKKISMDDVREVVIGSGASEIWRLSDDMLMGRTTEVLNRVQAMHPTSYVGAVRVCLTELGKCYRSSVLHSAGRSVDVIAERTSIKPWMLRNKYLRASGVLGKSRMIRMRGALIETERRLKSLDWGADVIMEHGCLKAMKG